MYRPKAFSVTDRDALLDLVEHASFGHLVSFGMHGFQATGLPFVVDRDVGALGRLRGHVARANQHWKRLDGTDVLVIFQLADGYVSPAWYPSKAEHGRVVPTWNYEVVHAHGRARVYDDVAWLRTLVTDLTDHHESSRLARPETSRSGRPESSHGPDDAADQVLRESSHGPDDAADQVLRESSHAERDDTRGVRYESEGPRDGSEVTPDKSGATRDESKATPDGSGARRYESEGTRYESGEARDDSGRGRWAVTDAPTEFVDAQLRAIVGIEVEITFLEGARKLSQNRPDADRAGVADALGASAHPRDRRLLDAMRTV